METVAVKKKMSLLARILIIAGILIAVVFILGIIAGNTLYNVALKPGSDKTDVLEADVNQVDFKTEDSSTDVWAEFDEASLWLEQNSTQARITSYDGLALNSYIVENEEDTGLWAILFHGYSATADSMAWFGQHFYDEGYSVMLPDARGHGESEGDYIGMGWHASRWAGPR